MLVVVMALLIGMVAAPASVRGSGQAAPGCVAGTPVAPSPMTGTATADVRGTRVTFGETEALLFGAGEYGVVLSHGAIYDAESWRPQAEAIAGAGMVALSLEQNGPEDILAGIEYLQEACAVDAVAVIGASAGGSTALRGGKPGAGDDRPAHPPLEYGRC